ncbi:hypothetical protein HWV62_44117 [Athelia sp. TMB]|nr:hypothetical protein HWV62_44117 [Athelia sp. TMB]
MNTAIRNTDGSLITAGVWDVIKLSSRQVAQSLLGMKFSAHETSRSKTKSFFKSFYPTQWTQSITQLEQLQPLLQLCASNWKANHVLGGTLAAIVQSKNKHGIEEAEARGAEDSKGRHNHYRGNTLPEFLEFLEHIETADPQAFNEIEDEDNLGSNWGHYQYTAGKLTLTSVIKAWASIGSPSYAIQLLAASLTTCNVARWLCLTHSVPPSCYLSDNYLAELATLLWSHWKAAGGPIIKGKDKYTEPKPPKDSAMQIKEDTNHTGNGPVNPLDALEPKVGGESGQSANTDTTMHDPQSAILDTHDLDPQDHKKSISILYVPELKQYAKDQGLSFRNKATKYELVEMICTLPSAQIPSEDTIQGIIRKRSELKKVRASSSKGSSE